MPYQQVSVIAREIVDTLIAYLMVERFAIRVGEKHRVKLTEIVTGLLSPIIEQ